MSKNDRLDFKSLPGFLAACGIALFAGCVSAPKFEPTRELSEAQSLNESLLLCDQYQIPSDAGRAVAFRPFLDCVEESVGRHSPDPTHPVWRFVKDLELRYSTLSEAEWTPQLGSELEAAVHAILRSLWREENILEATQNEKNQALRHFRQTAALLGAARWRVVPAVRLDPDLENLRAGVASLSSLRTSKAASQRSLGEGSAPTDEVCQKLAELQKQVAYLVALWQDRQDIRQLEPKSSLPEPLQSRYLTQLKEASDQLQLFRSRFGVEPRIQGCGAGSNR